MTALFELASNYRALSDKLRDLDLPEEVIADTLEAEGGDLQEKSINIAKFFRNVESDADQIEEAAKAMLARAKSLRGRAASLKHYLHTNMEKAGVSKIESPWFVISIKQNQESVVVDYASAVPDIFFRIIPEYREPDKQRIKLAIKNGNTVPGCHLERTTRIEIK
jgi:hypothetical protein